MTTAVAVAHMKHFDAIIIETGQAGPSLAARFANRELIIFSSAASRVLSARSLPKRCVHPQRTTPIVLLFRRIARLLTTHRASFRGT